MAIANANAKPSSGQLNQPVATGSMPDTEQHAVQR
jgi:hypothetical protein